jgi:hypothetical protein
VSYTVLGRSEELEVKMKPGIAAFPASKHPDKKGVRDVSLKARRHRDVRRQT